MNKVHFISVSSVALMLGAVAGPALAADQPAQADSATSTANIPDNGGLAEIVVTAQKRSENLQRVPIAITSLSSKSLVSAGIATTADLGAAVPGLSFRNTYGQIQPHLRGVGTTFGGPGQENAIAFYVDDVYYASAVATALTLSDVEQVSVLKGPQGTLFGRNANGGVIQVTTRDPSKNSSGSFETSIDNYATSVSNVYLTGALNDAVSANIAGQFTTQGRGWGHNIANGDQVHKTDHNIALRSKLLFKPDALTTVKLAVDYVDRLDSNGPNFVRFPGTLSTFPGSAPKNRWDVNSSITNRNKFTGGGASLSIDHDFGGFRVINISAYRGDKLDTRFDPTATPTPANGIFIKERTNQFTEELRLVSRKSDRFTWAAGVFGFYGNGKDYPLGVTLNPAITSYPALSGGPTIYINISSRQKTTSGAAYGQGTLKVLPDTNLTVGLRYTAERRSYVGTQTLNLYFAGPILLAPPTTAPDLAFPSTAIPPLPPRLSFGKLTYRLALDHQFGPDVLGYISYNRGFKSGGYNTQNPLNQPYLPETVDAFEAGIKSELFGRRLRVNAAGFYNKVKNLQVVSFTNVSFFQNGASAKTYGFDLDIQAKPNNNFLISAGLEWVNATFKSFPGANFYTPLPGGGATPYLADAAGNYLPNAPKLTGGISIDYIREISRGQIDLNVTNSFSSRYYQEANNLLSQPPFDLLNASIAWSAPGGHFSAKVWGKNLLNKAIIGQMTTNPYGGNNVVFNADYSSPPRTYGVSARYEF